MGQEGNETAAATAEHLVASIRSLRATNFPDLTKDAVVASTANLKAWLEAQAEPLPEPEPDPPPPPDATRPKRGKKKGKKRAKKA